MAYTPVDGSNIIANFVPSGTYTPVDGSSIVANFTTEGTINRRALLFSDGFIRQINDAEIGTGRKPVKTLGGEFLIVVGASLKTLGADETLLI